MVVFLSRWIKSRTFCFSLAFILILSGCAAPSAERVFPALVCRGAKVIRHGESVRIILPHDLFFESNSTKLNPDYFSDLVLIADFLKGQKSRVILIEGYTDKVKSDKINLRESKEIARHVAAFLWAQGVPHQRVRIYGLGSKRPIASEQTPEGSAYNRRVEIKLPYSH